MCLGLSLGRPRELPRHIPGKKEKKQVKKEEKASDIRYTFSSFPSICLDIFKSIPMPSMVIARDVPP